LPSWVKSAATGERKKEYQLHNYALHSFYTKENLTFFEEQVYMNREDIFRTKISLQQIFAHQKLNTIFFGSLTILPNGEVYTNVNAPSLDNLVVYILLDLISKEMLEKQRGERIRDDEPCAKCLYQYLCPSSSNYENVIGKPNLCHINS
jgi:pseudo-rSAM protein